MKRLAWFGACCVVVLLATGARLQAQETIAIDAQAPAKPFPHFWEQMFG